MGRRGEFAGGRGKENLLVWRRGEFSGGAKHQAAIEGTAAEESSQGME